mmetsp:Transcript_3324/g.4447  ORF Transcript_3324/g.4447 Transcript_3324/m.4447 type:complete len:145 (+) Transcript_3324:572-1006(+)
MHHIVFLGALGFLEELVLLLFELAQSFPGEHHCLPQARPSELVAVHIIVWDRSFQISVDSLPHSDNFAHHEQVVSNEKNRVQFCFFLAESLLFERVQLIKKVNVVLWAEVEALIPEILPELLTQTLFCLLWAMFLKGEFNVKSE